MSEQELKKWGNKLKLWRVLHPEMNCTLVSASPDGAAINAPSQTQFCISYCGIRKKEMCCGSKETLMWVPSRGQFYSTIKGIPLGGWCVEWVKYV